MKAERQAMLLYSLEPNDLSQNGDGTGNRMKVTQDISWRVKSSKGIGHIPTPPHGRTLLTATW